jgi:2,4-dienoyl-CoA reductase-like NADH-dependent reductase (Old Yellow Enzyme family)
LEQAGVDLLHISTGMNNYLPGNIDEITIPAYFHYNSVVYTSTKIKEQVKVPVILGNGIKTPLDAAYLVEKNYADFVSVGRGLLVDPDFVNKGQKYMQVRPCLRCKVCAYLLPDSTCPQKKYSGKYY